MSYKNTILEKIVEAKKEEISSARFRESLADLKSKARGVPETRDFCEVFREGPLTQGLPVTRIIAEIKKASPSAGLIRPQFDPVGIAKIYLDAGAAALSILTDGPYFQGHLDHLQSVRKISERPLLRKDFMIEDYQIYQARAYGADCILAIVAILEKQQLVDFCGRAEELGLSTLIEVHDETELATALAVNSKRVLLGINNRDLKTLKVDLKTTERLRPLVNSDALVVAESGFSKRDEIERLLKAKVNGFLIGETLLKAKDIKAKFKELIGS